VTDRTEPEAADEQEAAVPACRPVRRRWWWRVLRFLVNSVRNACTVVVIVYIGVASRYDRSHMVSNSMGPTLAGEETEGDWVLVRRGAYDGAEPKRGDLVQFRDFEGMVIIKRVVGLPGETVQIRDGRVLIDGAPLLDPPVFRELVYENAGFLKKPERKMWIRPGWYLVLGDNTGDSHDSRFYGPIQAKQLVGRADFIYWPPERIGYAR